MTMNPSDLIEYQPTTLDPDRYGRAVTATRIGGIVVYAVDGLGAKFEAAQPVTKPIGAVYELIEAHAPDASPE